MNSKEQAATAEEGMTLEEVREEILRDYRIVHESREASLLGRKEVLPAKPSSASSAMARNWPRWPWPNNSAMAIGAVATTAT
jgi:hypothetical protein